MTKAQAKGNPCKGCEDRYVGCHAECTAYCEWQREHKAELDAANHKRYIDGQADRRRKTAVNNYYWKKARGIL